MNNAFNGGASLSGMDGRDYQPSASNCDGSGNYSAAQGVNYPLNQDYGYYANLGLEDAYLFMREGLPMVYSDGFDHNTSSGTPVVSYANYLGEFSDNTIPETMSLRGQFFNALVILDTRTIEIRLLRRKFDRQVNVTQSLDLRFQHAAEENHPRYLAEEIRVVVDPLHSAKELLQRLLCRRACDPPCRCCGREGLSRLGYLPRVSAGGFDQSLS